MRNSIKIQLFCLANLMIISGMGCSSATDLPAFYTDLTPVSGVVTLGGEPLSQALINFIPQEGAGGQSASAVTDDKGFYELITPIAGLSAERSRGALPGSYRVVISKIAMPDGSPIPEGIIEEEAQAQGAREKVPAKYSDFDKTTLTADVSPGAPENESLNFELK